MALVWCFLGAIEELVRCGQYYLSLHKKDCKDYLKMSILTFYSENSSSWGWNDMDVS